MLDDAFDTIDRELELASKGNDAHIIFEEANIGTILNHPQEIAKLSTNSDSLRVELMRMIEMKMSKMG